ncbi:MAG: hypothetical protein R2764_21560 [Bacteroidales bacterium]
MKCIFTFFRNNKLEDYIFAGISYRKNKIDVFKEMGMVFGHGRIWMNNTGLTW